MTMKALFHTTTVYLLLSCLYIFSEALSGHCTTIRVCQNKDCCRRWHGSESLVDALKDITPPDDEGIHVLPTSCLGQCDKGPNICIREKVLHDCNDMIEVSAMLELALGDLTIPSKLVAATRVIEKACTASSREEKERYLSSVIQSLGNDLELCRSTALAHAHLLLAQNLLEEKRYEDALRSARKAVGGHYTARSLRVMADCYRGMGEKTKAVNTLHDLIRLDPQYKTKLSNEIKEIEMGQEHAY